MLDNLKVPLDSLVKDKISVPLYRAMYLDKMLEDHDDIAQNRDRTFRSLIKEFKTIDDSDFDVPDSLNDTMREYQKYGYKWIRALSQYGFGGILADDMGLGKTLQVIAVLLAEKQTASTTSLVVCPASLVYNWQEEFTRFAPEIRTATVTGTLSERKKILEQAASVDVLITSYDLLKRDAVYYKSHKFRWQIADEAQFIKNPKSSAAKAVKIINSNRRIALTGTPIENRLSEMWSIFDFLMPGFLFKYDEFRTKFETPIAKSHDADATERLQKMVAPFILRRLKKDVLKDLLTRSKKYVMQNLKENRESFTTPRSCICKRCWKCRLRSSQRAEFRCSPSSRRSDRSAAIRRCCPLITMANQQNVRPACSS